MGAKNGTVAERVWNHVAKDGGCWNWTGHKNEDGYGVIREGRLLRLAHRIAWETFNGRSAGSGIVRHGCDNRACCNPQHLFLGTQADNVRDRVTRGRSAIGARNANARFDPESVKTIRAEHGSGVSMASLARKHGVAFNSIRQIVKRQTWAHVE